MSNNMLPWANFMPVTIIMFSLDYIEVQSQQGVLWGLPHHIMFNSIFLSFWLKYYFTINHNNPIINISKLPQSTSHYTSV